MALFVALVAACGTTKAQDGHKWITLQADDGSVVRIDMTSRFIGNANATTKSADVVLAFEDGRPYPLNMRRYMFYCGRGHFKDITSSLSTPLTPISPGSVAAKVEVIVCAGAGPTISDQLKSPPPPDPPARWQDYCKGLSDEACTRMRRIVESNVTPRYCKPGFAVVPTSLSDEQLRVCYVMPPLR